MVNEDDDETQILHCSPQNRKGRSTALLLCEHLLPPQVPTHPPLLYFSLVQLRDTPKGLQHVMPCAVKANSFLTSLQCTRHRLP